MTEVDISFTGADVDLRVRHAELLEELSRPFVLDLRTRTTAGDVDLDGLIGASATVVFDRGALGRRTVTGICISVEQREGVENADVVLGEILYRYDVRIVPPIWLLKHRTNRRIFQHQSIPEIVKAVAGEWQIPVDDRLRSAYPKLEYRVQHGETDYAFVCRLLEDAGISWRFDGGKLVVDDRPDLADPRAPIFYTGQASRTTSEEYISDVHVWGSMRPGRLAIAAFDHRRPRGAIPYHATEAGAEGEDKLERFVYSPGASIIDIDSRGEVRSATSGPEQSDTATPAGDDQSHARHDEEEGYTRARQTLAGMRGPRRRVSFTTNRVDLGVGVSFSSLDGPALIAKERLVIIGAKLTFRVDFGWTAEATATFCDAPVRPEHIVERPLAHGLQSAYVVGPIGEEIYTDEMGRVRVRFPWDRSPTSDERRTCWLRVNESLSGAGMGVISTPRVGDEVLVAFYEGNPDMPVVVGRLHHVVAPTPSPLPGAASRTVWRTRSTPNSDGFHELAFEDKTGREVFSLRSERDLEKNIQNLETETIGQDQVVIVGRHHSTTITTNDTIEVGHKDMVTFATINDMHVADQGQPDVVPTATWREIIGQRITLTTGGAKIVLDGPDIVITAERDINWKAGGTLSIHGGPQVHINPPPVGRVGDGAKAPPPPDKVVWFKLTDDAGQALAGVRCYVEMGDGSTSAVQVTGADGSVRFAVDGDGPYEVKLGRPPEGGST